MSTPPQDPPPPGARLRALRWLARYTMKLHNARATNIQFERMRTEFGARLFIASPPGFHDSRIAGTPCRERQTGGGATLLYIHGGAFILFSARTHEGLAARLADPLGLDVVLPDYGRAPDHKFPVALDQVEAAFRAVAARGLVVVAGDSAGGNLALALLHRMIARAGPLPAAVICFSPWTDLTLSGASLAGNREADPVLPAERMPFVVEQYLGGADPTLPEASPLFGDFPGAPPVLIQVGHDEILYSDAERMVARLLAQGCAARLSVVPHGMHAFQLIHGWLPEAGATVAEATRFAARALGRAD